MGLSKLKRQARTASSGDDSATFRAFRNASGSMGENGAGADVRTPLIGRTQSWPVPHGGVAEYRNDHRVWVRWPVESFHVTYATLASNYVNVLLVFVPLGIVSGYFGWSATTTFALNFLAIVPLASLLSFATEELAAVMGETLGGLMNATFGNAVELIVSIVALKGNEIRIVQASMLGSILSNILLVLGCCFLIGGFRYHEQNFNTTVASTMSSLMAVASASLIIPATLAAAIPKGENGLNNVLILSRGAAIILLLLYVMFLVFQLRTHTDLFETSEATVEDGVGEAETSEEPERILSPVAAGIALLVITIAVAICAEYLVGSIDSIVESTSMSKTFIGLVLIPIVGNAAEHVTAVVVAYKNKMDLAIGVAIGSSLQIALFVTPFLVILSWLMGREMTLHFETFETVAFFLSMLVVTLLVMDGKSNYLEGGLCLGMYLIIAIGFYVYPDHPRQLDLSDSFVNTGR
ncbi:calcium/proton exchanger [Ascosphaera apis ARSEF 7405]|uniref:Vacuolar calcium ion transporter n=1 Tax=Ascosphaera apis ARSEF 7405 TaxID=392613 RepID=A0A168DJX7_9EURO|nr:calcium/proton exchanger [Ascosphaera apis ARSEF 7405]